MSTVPSDTPTQKNRIRAYDTSISTNLWSHAFLTPVMKCPNQMYVYQMQEKRLVPCGQCMACRINKRRGWTARIMMEAKAHPTNQFVTLTYDEENCPTELVPRDVTLFLKRLRKNTGQSFRYFAVGEYGDKFGRPHYHLALFGYRSRIHIEKNGKFGDRQINKAWQYKGYTTIDTLNEARSSYVAAYTVKKMTKVDDKRLAGRYPEFARMSRMPGIGIKWFSEFCTSRTFVQAFANFGDPEIPRVIRLNSKLYPVPYYLRKIASEETGLPIMSDETAQKWRDQEVLTMHQREALDTKANRRHQNQTMRNISRATSF